MKKYLVPFVALILAISFSAFTAPAQAHKKPLDQSYYWYEVDKPSQKIVAGTLLYAHAEKSVVPTECLDAASNDCLRGFSTPRTFSEDSMEAGDATIRFTN